MMTSVTDIHSAWLPPTTILPGTSKMGPSTDSMAVVDAELRRYAMRGVTRGGNGVDHADSRFWHEICFNHHDRCEELQN